MEIKKTRIKTVLKHIDFNNKKLKSTPGWETLACIFDIDGLYHSDDTRLTSYFMKVHYCTDSMVGWKAYFLDEEFIGTSHQTGRKHDENFDFISMPKVVLLREYLLSLADNEFDYNHINISPVGILNTVVDETYTIEYSSQIMHKTAIYNDQKVTIVETYNDYGNFYNVVIKLSNGEEQAVDCRELRFKYNTLD